MSTQSGQQAVAADVAAAEERYEGVGHSLRVVRERRGLALTDVSARLRIRRPYLEAIENGRFGELPGAVYISGFLRQYAEFLGLDVEQVLKTYQDEADAPLQRPVLNFPMPRPEDRTPRLRLVLAALVIAAVAYVLWYRHQEALRFGQELIQAVPARLAALIPASEPITLPPPAAPASTKTETAPPAPAGIAPPPAAAASSAEPPAQSNADSQSTETAAAPSAPVPAEPVERSESAQQIEPAAPTAPAVAAAAPAPPAEEAASAAPATYGALPANSRIQLEAMAPSWIQIRGPNNEQVFTRLLNTGERYLVPDRAGLTLLTGNAGGLRLMVDGKPLPPLGAEGEVKRGIVLEPERLKSGETQHQG